MKNTVIDQIILQNVRSVYAAEQWAPHITNVSDVCCVFFEILEISLKVLIFTLHLRPSKLSSKCVAT